MTEEKIARINALAKKSKTAGIDFQHVGQTIFHAEIGNRWFCLIRLNIYIILEY